MIGDRVAVVRAWRVRDVHRRAVGELPSVAVTTLIAYDIVHATLGIAVGFAVLLLVVDVAGWRFVSAMFDR